MQKKKLTKGGYHESNGGPDLGRSPVRLGTALARVHNFFRAAVIVKYYTAGVFFVGGRVAC